MPLEVAQGVLWLRMPLPFALDHINLWLLEDGKGWTLIDTGIANAETKALWEAVLAHPALGGKPVRRLICTHFHPDHMGLAGWLTERLDVPLWATQGEWATGMLLSLDTSDALIDAYVDFYRRAGFSDDRLALVRKRGNAYASRVTPCRAPIAALRMVRALPLAAGNGASSLAGDMRRNMQPCTARKPGC